MVRLFVVRALITTLKRAIAISDKLKPRTWAYFAFTQAVVAALCFWGYRHQSQQYVQAREESVMLVAVPVKTRSIYGAKSTAKRRVNPRSLNQRSVTSLRMTYKNTRAVAVRMFYLTGQQLPERSPERRITRDFLRAVQKGEGGDQSASEYGLSTASGAYQISYHRNWRDLRGLFGPEDFSEKSQALAALDVLRSARAVGFSSSVWSDLMDEWFYRRLPKFQPTFVSQPDASESTSLLDMMVKMLLLFQAIIFTIGSATSSVFLYLSYQRGKLDLKLKELQLREMEIKLENMERDRTRAVQEAAQHLAQLTHLSEAMLQKDAALYRLAFFY
ncbi:MAG TPA: hypothetical protein VGO96_08895 [Pyrinomonadaceae bacterium]|jgi:hypothetical protein|nr:hypothetical protein [Pyrinomonadaceae bacterium]